MRATPSGSISSAPRCNCGRPALLPFAYYIRAAERLVWADEPEELMQDLPRPEDLPPGFDLLRPISVTFIPATVFDNPVLLRAYPEYPAWLLSLPLLERERLLSGNWKIGPAAGLYFKREWCAVVD